MFQEAEQRTLLCATGGRCSSPLECLPFSVQEELGVLFGSELDRLLNTISRNDEE